MQYGTEQSDGLRRESMESELDFDSQSVDEVSKVKVPLLKRTGMRLTLCFLVLFLVTCAGANYLLVARPVAQRLGEDPRNSVLSLAAYYRYFIDASTVVLDLRKADNVAPSDLFRVIFQAAEALHLAGRDFDQVALSRSGRVVFTVSGSDFLEIGDQYHSGQNPVYLIRTLPEKLFLPGGQAAFGRWEGGLIGVVGKQMDDVNSAASKWRAGRGE